MTIFGRITNWFGSIGATTQSRGKQDTRPIINVNKSAPDVGIDGALQISSVWAAAELLADNIASLPLFVYKNLAKGNRELAREEQLYRMLHDSPNSRHTPMEFWVYLVMNYVFRGNAYCRLDKNAKGEVIAMWPLSSDQVQVTVLEDGTLTYEFYINGVVVIYSQDKILHFRDKGNGVIGMSRLDYMRSSINIAINAQNTTSNTYANNNKRPGVFMIDKALTEPQRKQIRENFKGLTEGGDDDLLVLEAGAKFEPLNMSPADVQMLETRKFSVEEIARWFGIPSILINDLANRVPYGNNSELIELFYKFKLRPMLVNFEQALRARVLTAEQRVKFTVEFSIEGLLRASLKDRVEIGAKQVQNGLKTRNEIRQLENDPAITGGDTLTAQVNLAPLDMLGKLKGMQNASQDTTAQ
jgi:HK97 family phage portal protein